MRKVAGKETIQPRNVLLLIAALSLGDALAQALPDPTRPPALLASSQEGTITALAEAPALQSTIVAPGRKLAVINGQTVKLGEKYGEVRVIKISETEVVLKNGKELLTLKLFPAIEKQVSKSSATAKSNGGR